MDMLLRQVSKVHQAFLCLYQAKTSLSQVFWFNSITLFLTFFYQLYTICMVGYVKAREAIAAEHSFPLSPITYKVKIGYSYLRIVYFCSILLIESIKCIYLVLTDSSQDVVLACGCSGALELALDVLLNPGDNVLLPKPGFSIYQTLSISRGHEVRHYNLLVRHKKSSDYLLCKGIFFFFCCGIRNQGIKKYNFTSIT